MRFTDAHTSSGVCSPTRYALLTGRYHWRTRLQSGIVNYLGELLIAPGRLTLASLLKQQGYRTGIIVRWPGTVKPNTRCERLVQQTAIMATLAEMHDRSCRTTRARTV
jgi:arylsulfatase A-like enzyme